MARLGGLRSGCCSFYSGQPPLNRLSFHRYVRYPLFVLFPFDTPCEPYVADEMVEMTRVDRNETSKMEKHLSSPEALFLLFR